MTDKELMAYIMGILKCPSHMINNSYAYPKDYIDDILGDINERLSKETP